MSELISRQAAIDVLNEICDRCGEGEKYNGVMCGACYMDGAVDCIEALPSAQPEIIYCKDCRKHNVNAGYKEDCCPLYEWRGVSYGHEHDYQYCCYAERRTDD